MRITSRINIFAIFLFFLFHTSYIPAQEKHEKRMGEIKVASELDYPPFCVVSENGSADGFSVQLLKEVLKLTGIKYQAIKVDKWSTIKKELEEGKIDVLPLVSYSPERDVVYDFSVPYLQMHGTIFVRKGDGRIRNEADLKDKEVIVMEGDTAHEYAKKKQLTSKLILTSTFEEAFKKLSNGEHDAILAQHLMGIQLLKRLGIENIETVGDKDIHDMKFKGYSSECFEQSFCFAVKAGDSKLLSRLNEGLSIVKANGTYDRLYDKWLGVLDEGKMRKTLIKSVWIVLITLLISGLFAYLWQRSLRLTIKKRTRELQELNDELESRVSERTKDLQLTHFSVDHASDFLLWVNERGEIVDVNETTCEELGYEKGELLGRKITEICICCFKNFDDCLQNIKETKVISCECEYKTKSGRKIPIDQHANYLFFENREYLFIHSRNISEHLEKDAKIQSMARFPSENPSPVLRISKNGEILYLNDASKKILNHLTSSSERQLSPEIMKHVQQAIETKQTISVDLPIGQRFHLFNFSPIENADYINAYGYDITERIHAKKAMKDAMEKAETANKAKSEFISNISHEIRTPLNGILGMTSLVAESDVSDYHRELLQIVLDSGYSLLEIVNSILEFSKIEAGKLDIHNEDFNLKELFESTSKSFIGMIEMEKEKRVNGEDKLKLNWSYDQNLPPYVNGDSGKLRQILVNLINNAFKFTERGSINISAKLAKMEFQTNYIEFNVTDTGIGISKDKQKKIFEGFTQVDSSSTRKYGGTGLGLTISAKLVKMLGGEIEVESEDGKGSVFQFTLPFAMSEESESHNIFEDTQSFNAEKSKTIMIVEDNWINARYIEEILKAENYAYIITDNGKDAVAIFKEKAIDLVLMDIQLPQKDGFDITKEMRELENPGKHVPIIAITAHAKDTDQELCFKSGMDDFLAKPFKKNVFLEKINHFLKPES